MISFRDCVHMNKMPVNKFAVLLSLRHLFRQQITDKHECEACSSKVCQSAFVKKTCLI